jgi:hypothetical protein
MYVLFERHLHYTLFDFKIFKIFKSYIGTVENN